MPFTKHSDAVLPPQTLSEDDEQRLTGQDAWEVGQVHPSDDTIVWDGERWTPRKEWEARVVEE
jgi:hypothetical protein